MKTPESWRTEPEFRGWQATGPARLLPPQVTKEGHDGTRLMVGSGGVTHVPPPLVSECPWAGGGVPGLSLVFAATRPALCRRRKKEGKHSSEQQAGTLKLSLSFWVKGHA